MSKLTKRGLFALFNGLMVISGNVLADPVNINVTGKVIAAPCVVNNNITELNVNLGTEILSTSLSNANSGSTPVLFDLGLTACPFGTTNVSVTFTGTPDVDSITRYKNTGTATNVAVELTEQNTNKLLTSGTSLTQSVLGDHSVTYKLAARAFSVNGSVTPGNISSVITVNFTYQ